MQGSLLLKLRQHSKGWVMSVIKDQLVKIISEQPEDSSYEEIVRELIFSNMVQRGLADSEAGRTISNEEMRRRIRSWRS